MNAKVKATIWYVLTAIFAVFGIIWTWSASPAWWPSLVAILGAVSSAVLGIVFTPPAPPAP